MKELVINVEGMKCQGCENRIKNAIVAIDGVKKVNANHKRGIVNIVVEDNIDKACIQEKIENIGFSVKEDK